MAIVGLSVDSEKMTVQDLLKYSEVMRVLTLIAQTGGEGRLVGGCVRDTLMDRAVTDIDIAVNRPIEKISQLFREAGFPVIPTGMAYGTITVPMTLYTFEITQLREDTKADGRHAIVTATNCWEKDAARRDFTINALYVDQYGDIYDYFHGLEDLKQGIVRFIGSPEARIQEDYLRILRYYRFVLFYGKQIDGTSSRAVSQFRSGLNRLSKERIQTELFKILEAIDPIPTLKKMQEDGVFEVLWGCPLAMDAAEILLSLRAKIEALENFSLLTLWTLIQQPQSFFRQHFRLTHAQLRILKALEDYQEETFSIKGALKIRYAYDLPIAQMWLLFKLAQQKKGCKKKEGDEAPLYDSVWRALKKSPLSFPLKGCDLLEAGMMPGPPVGEVLKKGLFWWIEGGAQANKQACLVFCLSLIKA